MVTTVRLTVQTGPHKDKRFCFCGATRCLIGRAPDCFVQLTGTARDQMISRRHCELAIDPPSIRIQDLGSCNGTYINGKPVEATELALVGNTVGNTEATGDVRIGQAVESGDLLTIGGTTFQVDVVECPPKGKDGSVPIIWEGGETARKDCPINCSGT
jgi:pSer/pThr/pTyr-binding forkhead associated (FHA) protein